MLSRFKNQVFDLGQRLIIRSVQEKDVSAEYVAALNDKNRTMFMSYGDRPIETPESVKAYVSTNEKSNADVLFGLFLNNVLIGTSRLHDINETTAWIGVFLFSQGVEGKGLGSQLVKYISDLALSQLSLIQIYAAIKAENQKSKNCFAKSGFHFSHYDENYSEKNREIWIKKRD